MILLPEADCRDAASLSAILAHEIAHVRGRDLAWNAMLRLLAVALWFHPLVWRVRRTHAAACDRTCDAVAAHLTGNVSEYGRTLARLRCAPMERRRFRCRWPGPRACQVGSKPCRGGCLLPGCRAWR